MVLASRLRRSDARSGWVIVVGGAFLTCAVAFSTAKGIFHPYYVSLLAPFTAALVGALRAARHRRRARVACVACLGVAGAVTTELMVLHNRPGELAWLSPVLFVGRRRRRGHAGRRPAVAGAPHRAGCRAGAGAAGARRLGGADPGPRHQRHLPRRRAADDGNGGGGPGGGGGGGSRRGWRGPFGGNSQTLAEAVAYARANGGGTVVTGSQQGSAAPIIDSGADVAAIGGFSGRESQVSTSWLADAVREGRVRWVLADQGGIGGPQDDRVGDRQVMSTVADTCEPVSSVSGLYDCRGSADALARASG